VRSASVGHFETGLPASASEDTRTIDDGPEGTITTDFGGGWPALVPVYSLQALLLRWVTPSAAAVPPPTTVGSM
jgi:hypothetical protein